jgi:hypothetical protein
MALGGIPFGGVMVFFMLPPAVYLAEYSIVYKMYSLSFLCDDLPDVVGGFQPFTVVGLLL